MTVEEAKELLQANGFAVVKERTYRNMQEDRRGLRQQLEFEERATEHAREWGIAAHDEIRRVSDRLTFVYGEARAAGCTVEQLAGPFDARASAVWDSAVGEARRVMLRRTGTYEADIDLLAMENPHRPKSPAPLVHGHRQDETCAECLT